MRWLNFNTRQNPLTGVLLFISRILSRPKAAGGHIPGTDVAIRLVRLKLVYSYEVHESTALHASKDLAVSPVCCHTILPKGKPFPFGSGVTARTSWIAPDGSYPLPVSAARERATGVSGLSSLGLDGQERPPNPLIIPPNYIISSPPAVGWLEWSRCPPSLY